MHAIHFFRVKIFIRSRVDAPRSPFSIYVKCPLSQTPKFIKSSRQYGKSFRNGSCHAIHFLFLASIRPRALFLEQLSSESCFSVVSFCCFRYCFSNGFPLSSIAAFTLQLLLYFHSLLYLFFRNLCLSYRIFPAAVKHLKVPLRLSAVSCYFYPSAAFRHFLLFPPFCSSPGTFYSRYKIGSTGAPSFSIAK